MNPLGDSREAKAGVRLGALRRPVGWGSAAALVVASMIGTGVFTTSGFLLTDLGSPWAVLAVWVAGGILATIAVWTSDPHPGKGSYPRSRRIVAMPARSLRA